MKNGILSAIAIVFSTLTLFSQGEMEALKIEWPDEYNWKVGSEQEDQSIHMLELIPAKEKITKWTIIGTMMTVKGAKNVPMDVAMNLMYDQAKQDGPKATLTMIEKDEPAEHPWILFKIEAPGFISDKNPESQLYYIRQGKTSLYSNFVAIKEKSLSDEFVQKWSEVFKASELIYQ